MIRKIPIPMAGLVLGLASMGNLLRPCSEYLWMICGCISMVFFLLLLLKILIHPRIIIDDLNTNSIYASVFAAFFMSLLSLCTYGRVLAPKFSEVIWYGTIALYIVLIIWFTLKYIIHIKINEVFTTYFLIYAGSISISSTSSSFNNVEIGTLFFWFGFIIYLFILPIVVYRYVRIPVPDSAKPLFCIFTGPMGLSVVGYLAAVSDKSIIFLVIMEIISQIFLLVVVLKLPKLLCLPFYPSYAAFTFSIEITAIGLRDTVNYLKSVGFMLSNFFNYLIMVENILTTLIVCYVLIRYITYLYNVMIVKRDKINEEKE